MVIAAGDILFQQGDPGGDLYFIESGVVEIYTIKDQQDVVLSEMREGEIIGVMTCLSNDKRMASARAKTTVTCKKVPQAAIAKILSALPNWLNIILKEFSLRLTNMNKLYSEASLKVKRLEVNQISNQYLGIQLAAAIANLADLLAITIDGEKFIVIETLLDKLELVLNVPKDNLSRLFAVLQEAGLLKVEIEPDKKRTVAKLDTALKLSHFVQFVREAKHGPARKLVRAKFTHKETRVMSAMVKFAARLGMDLEKTCKIGVKDLERSLEKATGVRFELDALDRGVELKLLAVKEENGEQHVVMRPAQLGRTVACVEALRKLSALDGGQQARGAQAS
jgi:CRP-like cAMP-binding protein